MLSFEIQSSLINIFSQTNKTQLRHKNKLCLTEDREMSGWTYVVIIMDGAYAHHHQLVASCLHYFYL